MSRLLNYYVIQSTVYVSSTILNVKIEYFTWPSNVITYMTDNTSDDLSLSDLQFPVSKVYV